MIYGKTLDHVLEVDAILSDGSRTHFAPITGAPLEERMTAGGLEGTVYREARRLAHEHADEIQRRFPKLLRRVMGYNLDDFMGDGPMNLTRALVGSEGTLAMVTEAKVNLVPLPAYKGMGVVHFTDLIECMEAAVPILEHSPSAVELVGHMIIDNCRRNPGYRHLLGHFMGDPRELLFVEFYGDSEAEVRSKLAALKSDMERHRLGYATMVTNNPAQQREWYALREAGLGLAMSVKGDAKPLPYVEDTAVSPEQLPEYVRRFEEIVARHATEAAYYGHASTGCLHIRPMVNMKTEGGVEKMAAIAEEISDLVLEFGGSLTGEHGDGIVRGVFTEKMFGSEIYGAFRELKAAFDPDSVMNPGKIIDTPGIRENLRISPATRNAVVPTYLDFAKDGGLAGHVELCNSQGACRKLDGGMCPSFMVTREEEHSTRGRATDAPYDHRRAASPQRAYGQAPAGHARPLRRVQGVRGRVPVQRGHGGAEVRGAVEVLRGARRAAARAAVRRHRPAQPHRASGGAADEPPEQPAVRASADGAFRGRVTQASASPVRSAPLQRVASPSRSTPPGSPRRRRPVQRYVH